MAGALVHIAGPDVQVGGQMRQRCAWCGALLADYDLAHVAAPIGQDPTPAMWPAGELVAVDGPASWTVPHTDGEQLPSNACAQLDPAATR
jgi:hypothetical protein